MNKELDKELFEKYPELFRYKDKPQGSLMGFGFAVGDGWYDLVRLLCATIYNEVEQHNKRYEIYHTRVKGHPELEKNWSTHPETIIDYPQVDQVKEKFGGLRFYIGACPSEIFDTISGAVEFAEALSYTICEDCGNKGKSITIRGWIRTLCKSCVESILDSKEFSKLDRLNVMNEYSVVR